MQPSFDHTGAMRHVLFTLALLVCTLGGSCRKRAETRAPLNVLLITLDTVRADRIGTYGHRTARTPAIDALAARGVRFDEAISPVPLTLPAHASLFTGTTPLKHAVHLNGERTLSDDCATLASSFTAAGYRTGAFIGAFVLDRRFGLNRGFEHYDDEIDREATSGSTFEAERSGNVVVDRALSWMRSLAPEKPFFAWIHLYDAHAPYRPPPEFANASSPYDGEIAFIDSQLARLIEALEQLEVRDRTIVVVVGDHGEGLGDHGEQTHGLLLYRSTLRVPLIITVPGSTPRVVRNPVSLIDVAPTVASLASVAAPAGAEGRDLSTLVLGGVPEPDDPAIYSETEYPRMLGWSSLASLQEGNLRYLNGVYGELFDLSKDPEEMVDRLGERRREARHLAALLAAVQKKRKIVKSSPVDPETAAKLASLGYLTPARASLRKGMADPRKMAPLFGEHERAMALAGAGELDRAAVILGDLVKADPRNPLFRAALARVRRDQGRLKDAVLLFKETLTLSPEDPDAWYDLGVALQEAGENREAETVLGEAVRRNPERSDTHNALALVLVAEKRPDEALAALDAAIATDRNNARAWNNRGNLLREAGRLSEAEEAYRQAVTAAPGYGDPLNGLGTLAVQQSRPLEAVTLFERALRLSPSNHALRLNRAIALHTAGKSREAAEGYRDFIHKTAALPAYLEQRRQAQQLLAGLGD